MLWPLKTNGVWNETQEGISTDCEKSEGGELKSQRLPCLLFPNQTTMLSKKKRKEKRKTYKHSPSCWEQHSKCSNCGQGFCHLIEVSQNKTKKKHQKAINQLSPKSQRESSVSTCTFYSNSQGLHKLFVWVGNPAGANPVCPQQFSEPVECHLALLSWRYFHPYLLYWDKGQNWVGSFGIVVGRQVTVEIKKIYRFLWGRHWNVSFHESKWKTNKQTKKHHKMLMP